MLVIPLHKKPGRDNLPLVTGLLLVINLIVFFGFQSGDREVEMEAAEHYLESGLSEQEWEWFSDYLSMTDQPFWDYKQELDHLATRNAPKLLIARQRATVIDAHPRFLDDARNGAFLEPGSEAFRTWRDKRRTYEAIIDGSFTNRFMLSYDQIHPVNLFSHMFMHGGLAHLLGNMLFLVLLGLLVEGALGRGLFLGCYLVAGLGAATASLAVNWGTGIGMLGASGAIAGLMGLYTVLYGLRRVRFFYWFFVYFDYVRAPALLLLPVWLGWELLQFFMAETNVAYDAHIGGIVTGALLAAAVRRLGWENRDFLDEDTQKEQDTNAVTEARDAIAALKPDLAKLRLRPLLERHGQDTGLLKLWYTACKLKADDPDIHAAAARIFALPARDDATRDFVRETARDYLGRGRIRLRPAELTRIAGRLAAWGDLAAAERLVRALARLKTPPPGLAATCLQLAEALIRRSAADRAGPYLDLAQRHSQEPMEQQRIEMLRREI